MNAAAKPPEPEPVVLEGFGPKDLYERREKIFTRYVGGHFQKIRFWTGWPLLFGFFATPWLQWEGRQAVLFDLPERQFHIFDVTLWPQDLWILAWLLAIAAFALFTMTSVVGRIYCGYTCPQTVWTAIYMWAEQVAEGPRHARVRLDNAPWTLTKIRKRTLKHTMWIGFALLTAITFVGYFTPVRPLVVNLSDFSIQGWALFWVGFFTLATYANAGFAREQVCKYACPYARFQSAMIDADTLVVSYDGKRGEPRSSRKLRERADASGDCVDCRLCVQVCPTGIDIRNGLQYECIGCAHCIDACNQVMRKLNRPENLIRYTTQNVLDGNPFRWLHWRRVAYFGVCAALAATLATLWVTRADFEVNIIRERGVLFHEVADGRVRNDYSLKLLNKSSQAQTYAVSVKSPTTDVEVLGSAQWSVSAKRNHETVLQLIGNRGTTPVQSIELEFCSGTDRCVVEVAQFLSAGSGS